MRTSEREARDQRKGVVLTVLVDMADADYRGLSFDAVCARAEHRAGLTRHQVAAALRALKHDRLVDRLPDYRLKHGDWYAEWGTCQVAHLLRLAQEAIVSAQ